MTNSPIDVSPLLGGVSFLTPAQEDPKVRVATASTAPKRTPAQRAVDQLLSAIARGQAQEVLDVIGKCSPTGLLPKRAAKALVAQGFNPGVAGALLDHGFLDARHVVEAMRNSGDWTGMGWLTADERRIVWMENNVGTLVNQGQTRAEQDRKHLCFLMLRALEHPTGLAAIHQSNLPFLVRDLSQAQAWYIAGHNNWLTLLISKSPTPEQIAALDLLFDPALMKSAAHTTDEAGRWRAAATCDRLLSWACNHADEERLQALETFLQQGENMRRAWEDYWRMPEDRKDLPSITTLAQFLGVMNSPQGHRCGVKVERHINVLDTLLGQPNTWLLGVLRSDGPLSDALWERIRVGPNQLFSLVMKLEYGDINPLLPHIIDRLGEHWRDTHGLGLGEILLLAYRNPGRTIIQRLLRDPRGREVLTVRNAKGKSAMDVIVSHDHWHEERAYVAQLARKLLLEQSGGQQGQAQGMKKSNDKDKPVRRGL